MQTSAPALQIKDIQYSPPVDPYPFTMMRVVLANSYPNGVPSVDPTKRYFLESVEFDHSFSVDGPGDPPNSCGGFEQGMGFTITNATYLTPDGIELPGMRGNVGRDQGAVSLNEWISLKPNGGSMLSRSRILREPGSTR